MSSAAAHDYPRSPSMCGSWHRRQIEEIRIATGRRRQNKECGMKRHASMNRVYRLRWSEAAGAWIAVAETSHSQGKSVCSRRLLAATLLLVGPLAYAAPGGGQIVSGSGSISQAGTITTIRQSSPTLSLNWKTFN